MSVIGGLAGGADRVIGGIIALQDNATGVLQSIRQEQSRFREDVARTRIRLRDTFNQRYRTQVETTPAVRAVNRVITRLQPLRRRVVTTLAVADLAAEPIRAAARRLRSLAAEAGRVGGQLKNLAKGVAIPISIAGGVSAAALGATVASGMQLEQQQVAMSHFIQAGSRAVAISEGDTQSAMRMIELAEDMAAASGGTASISDAIEALADAKMGEMERLKSFGFKVSAEEFKAKGFAGVQADLQDFFGGAANKLATTGSGLLSTITGKLKSYVADFGLKVVDELKPALSEVIGLVDRAAPAIERFGTAAAAGIGKGIKTATAVIPRLAEGVASVMRRLEAARPVITGIFNALGTAAGTLAPVLAEVFDGISQKVGAALNFVGSKMGWVQKIISKTAPVIASVIKTAWNVISPVLDIAGSALKALFNVVSTVFEGILNVVSAVWSKVEPIINGIASALDWVSQKVSAISGGKAAASGVVKSSGAKVIGDAQSAETGETKTSKISRPKIGRNAKGTDNWRGGLTWVGEEGAELLELPGGSRILPHRQSVTFAAAQQQPAAETLPVNVQPVVKPNLTVIEGGVGGEKPAPAPAIPAAAKSGTDGAYAGQLAVMDKRLANMENQKPAAVPQPVPTQTPVIQPAASTPAVNVQPVFTVRPESPTLPVPKTTGGNMPQPAQNQGRTVEVKGGTNYQITVNISRLADRIEVRSEQDIDAIGEKVAKEVVLALKNAPKGA